jgi:hypothetical protein
MSLRKANKYWNILLTLLSNHLNGRTKTKKVGLQGVPTKKEDAALVIWILNMQKVGLSITFQ